MGIESSCDETAVAVYSPTATPRFHERVARQYKTHAPYGGVVPELASRRHLETISMLAGDVCTEASIHLSDIQLIGATAGPGLAGALIVGLCYSKALAYAIDKPYVGVNHIEAHMYAACAEQEVEYPFISLVVSGGHTILADISSPTEYTVIGTTRDDAAGEAFDKGAKILGLGFPGGQALQKAAQGGDVNAYKFPRAMLADASYDFSFSGLKTALLYFRKKNPDTRLADVAASYQEAIVDVLVKKSINAACAMNRGTIVIGGGVSANARLRETLVAEAERHSIRIVLPSFAFCTDNAQMIAFRAYQQYVLCGEHELTQDIFPSFNCMKQSRNYET